MLNATFHFCISVPLFSLPGQSIVVDISTKLGSHDYRSGAYLLSAFVLSDGSAFASNDHDAEKSDWTPMVPVYFKPKLAFGTHSKSRVNEWESACCVSWILGFWF